MSDDETDADAPESKGESKFQGSYFRAILWTCKTCGFVKEGEQPHMECPVCEGYKSNFIDIPQHLEAEIREEHPDKNPNHRACREMRLQLMQEEKADEKNKFTGRMLPSESGSNIDPSSKY